MRLIGTSVRVQNRDSQDNSLVGEILATKITAEGDLYLFIRLGYCIVRHHYKNVIFLEKDVHKWIAEQEAQEKYLDGQRD